MARDRSGRTHGTSRRRFLIGGALALGGLFVGWRLLDDDAPVDVARLLDAADGEAALNAWLKIGTDGVVTVVVPRAEMGQGVRTALPMILAEELDADWSMVRAGEAKIDKVYVNAVALPEGFPFGPHDQGFLARQSRATGVWLSKWMGVQFTGGSTSVRAAWTPMREAGAMAREMLKAAAAERFGVPLAELSTRDGQVMHAASGRAAGYGDLAALAATMPAPERIVLKQPAEFRLIGTSRARLDIPAKVDGSALFGTDVVLPGMLHATVRHPPVTGATVTRFDPAQVARLPGVVRTVAVPGAVAVIADSHWHAQQALDALAIEYDAGENAAFSSDALWEQYAAALDESGFGYQDDGDAEAVLEAATDIVEATYRAPFLAHAPMEPITCTARLDGDRLEIWAPTQAPMVSQWIGADEADLPEANVTVHVTLLGGGFGRKGEPDFIRQAVACAKAVPGRPVRLLWTREEDIRHDTYRPAAMARFRASVDDRGMPLAWHNRLVGPSVSGQATMRYLSFATDATPDRTSVDGAAWLPYAIPDMRVEHVLSRVPVRVGFWRSVGHSQNAWFSESFIDELAARAGADSYDYRRALLSASPRYLAVLDAAAEMADWRGGAAPGRAFGIALHESFGAIVAQVTEVGLQDGRPRVHRVWCAVDTGIVINPDTVVAQMESGIVYGLSAALHGEITFRDGQPEQSNFPDYEVVRMADAPVIETRIIASTEPPGGAGEPGTPPVAPAVAGALFRLTGRRARELPLSRQDWSSAGA